MKTKLAIISLLCVLCRPHIYSVEQTFNKQWAHMQSEYKALCDTKEDKDNYYQPYWIKIKNSVRKLILGKPNQRFLHEPYISQAMIRTGISKMEKYKILHLNHCIAQNTKQLLTNFRETDFPLIPRECKEFNCTTSSLSHLFYATKILEQFDTEKKIETIVEFGGGYGNLVRIFKMLLPDITAIIFDIPEFIAIQSLFLKETLPKTEIIIHTTAPQQFKRGAIHLVPVFLLDKAEINADVDVFVSTFAISEAPALVQNKVINKKFFNAKVCYVIGQLKGWGGLFIQQNTLIDGIRSLYPSITCQPFHTNPETIPSYEITASVI